MRRAALHALLGGCRTWRWPPGSRQRARPPAYLRTRTADRLPAADRQRRGLGSRAAVRPVRPVAVRREFHRDEPGRGPGAGTVDLARRAGAALAKRGSRAAALPAISG